MEADGVSQPQEGHRAGSVAVQALAQWTMPSLGRPSKEGGISCLQENQHLVTEKGKYSSN